MVDQDAESTENEELIISLGMLDMRVVEKPAPAYPVLVKAARLRGRTIVEVLIDERGNVVRAEVQSGHPVLRGAVVAAAKRAKFRPTLVNGRRVKVSGLLTYELDEI